ncbi:MAG: O-antigen polymerase [Polaribacter sp.]|uniref:O-antigen polymerase n=1 Tax=Polaribacter sp. TaxID=1920175 RepID=UPI003BAF76C8
MEIKSSKERKVLVALFVSVTISIVFESIFIDKISIFIIFLSLILLGKSEKKFLNPYYLFSPTPLSLLVYFNVADSYMLDLTHDTYLLAIINMVAFIVTFMFTSSVKINKNILNEKKNSNLFLKINALVLFVLALMGSVIPALNSILWLFAIPAIVCSIKTKEKKMLILVAAYILLVTSINLSKMQVLLYLITFFISFEKFHMQSKKQGVWIKIFAILGIVFLVFSFSFANKDRGKYDAEEGLSYYYSQGVEWNYDSALFLPYMYITTAWANLQYVTESQNTRTYGLWVLKPFLGYLNLDKELNLEKSYELEPYSSFNTFTFVTVGYKDFGYWLSVLSPIIIGFFVKKVYSRFLISDSPFDIATYIIFALAVAEMFFSNHFYMQSYPFTMLILRFGYKSVVKSI